MKREIVYAMPCGTAEERTAELTTSEAHAVMESVEASIDWRRANGDGDYAEDIATLKSVLAKLNHTYKY